MPFVRYAGDRIRRVCPRSAIQLQVETTLDFDRLVLLGAGEGEATLLPTGQRSSTGSIATVGAGAMVGSVTIRGEPGRVVAVDLPRRIELFSISGGRIAIESVESDLPRLPKLDSAGILIFRFGGRLRISGEAEGEYRGNVPIFVDLARAQAGHRRDSIVVRDDFIS